MFVFDFRFDRVDLDFDFGTNVSCFLFRGTSQIESRLHKGWDDPNRAVLAFTPGDCIDNRIRCNENRDWCIVGPETRIAADLREARNAYDNRVVALPDFFDSTNEDRRCVCKHDVIEIEETTE